MQKKIFSNAALCHDFGGGRWKGVGKEEGESVEEEEEMHGLQELQNDLPDTFSGTDVECLRPLNHHTNIP
jgi:hypothetical protein